jgi:hypothetical protein
MSIAKLVSCEYSGDSLKNITWVWYKKSNASATKKIKLLKELLDIDDIIFAMRYCKIFDDLSKEYMREVTRKRGRI